MSDRTYFNLPENLAEVLVQPLEEIPSGNWSDFNKLHKLWKILEEHTGSKELLLKEDLPAEPKVSDYEQVYLSRLTNIRLLIFSMINLFKLKI